jgi:hypothetical protein
VREREREREREKKREREKERGIGHCSHSRKRRVVQWEVVDKANEAISARLMARVVIVGFG